MMCKWLARKLFDLAVWLDWDEAVLRSMAVLIVEAETRAQFLAPKKKRGRPAGRKDSVAGVPPKPKRGRPLGSKNKSASGNNKSASSKDKSAPKKIGRPLGSKNKPKVQP